MNLHTGNIIDCFSDILNCSIQYITLERLSDFKHSFKMLQVILSYQKEFAEDTVVDWTSWMEEVQMETLQVWQSWRLVVQPKIHAMQIDH